MSRPAARIGPRIGTGARRRPPCFSVRPVPIHPVPVHPVPESRLVVIPFDMTRSICDRGASGALERWT